MLLAPIAQTGRALRLHRRGCRIVPCLEHRYQYNLNRRKTTKTTFDIVLEITTYGTGAVSVDMLPVEGELGQDERTVNAMSDALKRAVFDVVRQGIFVGK